MRVLAQVTEAEFVGGAGRDIGGHAEDQEPGILRSRSRGCRHSQGIARQEAADVRLVVGQVDEPHIAVAAEEAPLIAEIMVDTGNVRILCQWLPDGR
jgi:hypothetical protein